MMKKLLVLALVLSIATIANAQLTITLTGPSSLAKGAVGTYTVGYSMAGAFTGGAAGDDLALVGSDTDITGTLGTIGGGAFLTTNIDTAVVSFIQTSSTITSNYRVALMNDVVDTDMGSPLFKFTYTAGMVGGTGVIKILENAFIDTAFDQITGEDLAAMPQMNVTITPEPMTLGLLAIGGLFLRRRK